jgi:bla regulator protein BlaR1
MKGFKIVVLLLLCSAFLTGCKGDISSQALTDFKDYESYFEGTDGCFVLYQNKLNKYWMYNGFLSNDPVSPDETFDIFRTLMGLQLELIKTMDEEMPSIGQEDLAAFMEELNYGNKDVTGPSESYWLQSSLKITPVQQVELLRRLYIQVLPFSETYQTQTKEQLFIENFGASKLYGKVSSSPTGNAWFMGFVEKENTAYFFAVRLAPKKGQTGEDAKCIAIRILKDEGLLEVNQ